MSKLVWGAVVLPFLLLTMDACVSSDLAAVHTDPDFFYGYGSGPTEAAAKNDATLDLIYNVLTETGSIPKEKKAKVAISAQEKAVFTAFNLNPYVLETKDTVVNAVYRLNRADWAKAEDARLAKLSADLGGQFAAVTTSKKSLGDRIAAVAKISVAIDDAGVPLTLRASKAADAPVLSLAIAQWAKDQLAGLTFTPQPAGGLVKAGAAFKVLVTGKGQTPLAGIPVVYTWNTDAGSSPSATLVTDPTGAVSFTFPADDQFKNRQVILKLGTKLAADTAIPYLVALDGAQKVDFPYRNADDLAKVQSNQIRIAGGTFTVGAVKQDRRAGGNEKPRTVTLATFAIDRDLVTNAQYISFLQATNVPKDAWPDYLDSADYNGANQPVIGVSQAQASQYAAWLSGVLGQKLRLPSEDEYEVAARAGQVVIFPWGDQSPTDGVRAAYSGNKKFAATAPVGSFDNGKNPWGLDDMSGNVWEWTSTSPDGNMSADPSYKIVKGGSWLDGPNELRISNRRAVDPGVGTSDIGFRLVREDVQ